jgi:hypothetical protein
MRNLKDDKERRIGFGRQQTRCAPIFSFDGDKATSFWDSCLTMNQFP